MNLQLEWPLSFAISTVYPVYLFAIYATSSTASCAVVCVCIFGGVLVAVSAVGGRNLLLSRGGPARFIINPRTGYVFLVSYRGQMGRVETTPVWAQNPKIAFLRVVACVVNLFSSWDLPNKQAVGYPVDAFHVIMQRANPDTSVSLCVKYPCPKPASVIEKLGAPHKALGQRDDFSSSTAFLGAEILSLIQGLAARLAHWLIYISRCYYQATHLITSMIFWSGLVRDSNRTSARLNILSPAIGINI